MEVGIDKSGLVSTLKLYENYVAEREEAGFSASKIVTHYTKQLKELLATKPHLRNIECICVNMGYSDRIDAELAREMGAALVDPGAMDEIVVEPQMHGLIESALGPASCLTHTVVFDSKQPCDVFDIVDMMGSFHICGCCWAACILQVAWAPLGNGKFAMVCDVDTEA